MLRDSSQRCWMIQAFYPTVAATSQTYSYMPGTLAEGVIKGVKIVAHSNPNSELSNRGPFPVIIFIPGFGEVRQSYTILCEELASHGYVILSLDQPYVSSFVHFSNNKTIVPTFYDSWKVSRDRDYRYQYYDEAMSSAIADIKYMLDHFEDFNTTYFLGQLNKDFIALMGHSFGGNVAHTLGFGDDRIKAVVDIDSKITERKIYGRIGVPLNSHGKPVLFIRGTLQYQEDVGDQLTKIQNAEIWNPIVQHSAFRDMAYLTRQVNDIGYEGWSAKLWNWLLKKGPLFDAVDTDLGGQAVDTWFNEYRKQIVRWLDQHLKKGLQ